MLRRARSKRAVLLTITFVTAALAWLALPTQGAAPAREAYDAAYAFERQGKFAEAVAAYKNVVDRYATDATTLAARGQLAGLQAAQGKAEEAFQSYVAYLEGNLTAANTPRAKWPSPQAIGAQARWRVARALRGSPRADRYTLAKAQYQKLLDDFPGVPLAREAQKKIAGLNALLAQRAALMEQQAAIQTVIKAYENEMKAKNAAGVVALLAAAPQDDALSAKLRQHFSSERHKQYEYTITAVRFTPAMSEATVMTEAAVPNQKPGRKLFRLIKTALGWRLQRL